MDSTLYKDLCDKQDEMWKIIGENLSPKIDDFSYDKYLELVIKSGSNDSSDAKDKLHQIDEKINYYEKLISITKTESADEKDKKDAEERSKYYKEVKDDFITSLKNLDGKKFIEYRKCQFIANKFNENGENKNKGIACNVKYDNKGNCYIETNGKIDEMELPDYFERDDKDGSISYNTVAGKKKIEIRGNEKSKDENQGEKDGVKKNSDSQTTNKPKNDNKTNQNKQANKNNSQISNSNTKSTSKHKSNKYNRIIRKILNRVSVISLSIGVPYAIFAALGSAVYAGAIPLGIIATAAVALTISATSLTTSLVMRAKEKKNVNKKDGKSKSNSKLLSAIKKIFGKVIGKNKSKSDSIDTNEANFENIPDTSKVQQTENENDDKNEMLINTDDTTKSGLNDKSSEEDKKKEKFRQIKISHRGKPEIELEIESILLEESLSRITTYIEKLENDEHNVRSIITNFISSTPEGERKSLYDRNPEFRAAVDRRNEIDSEIKRHEQLREDRLTQKKRS